MPVALVLAALAGCGGADEDRDPRQAPRAAAPIVSAMAPLPGGGVRVGELATGRVRDLPSGRVVARLEVSAGGQRGLLGLAVDPAGVTFAAYTDRSLRLVVDRVAPGASRRVWRGPATTRLGVGGHLAWEVTGRLLVGVGDLGRSSRIDDPAAVNGKLLALDPEGAADQRPVVLSRGWHNPFAFDRGADGLVWVADNAPGRLPERIARGDTDGGPPAQVTELPGRVAPAGVALLSARELVLCGVVSGVLDRYRLRRGRWRHAGRVAPDCRYGVARLTDGRLAVSGMDGVQVISP